MAKANWKETVELIGILAIVASLIALVLELQQTQSALLASTYQARAFDAIAEERAVADSEFLLPILVASAYGEDKEAVAKLGDADRARLLHYLRSRMIDWDNEHYQYENGFLDADFFEVTTSSSIKIWAPRWRAIGLTEGRHNFKVYVDRVLEEGFTDTR